MLATSLFLPLSLIPLESANSKESSDSIQIAFQGLPSSFNPYNAKDTKSLKILFDIHEGLTTFDSMGNVIPGIAKSWKISEDGKRYTFTLRENARWSDGADIVADHFVRRWVEATADKNSKGSFFFRMFKNHGAVKSGSLPPTDLGVKAVGRKSIIIDLSSPFTSFDKLLAFPEFAPFPYHREHFHNAIKDWDRISREASSGAYYIHEVKDDQILLLKNTHHYDKNSIHFESVTIYNYENSPGKIINDITLGKVHIGEIRHNSEQLDWLHKRHPDNLKFTSSPVLLYLHLNSQDSILSKNQDIRKALQISLNLEEFAESSSTSYIQYQPTYSLAPEFTYSAPPLKPEWSALSYQKRRQQAIELLRKNGYSSDHPLKISLGTENSDARMQISQMIKVAWHSIGVETSILESPANEHNAKGSNLQQASLFGWSHRYKDPFSYLVMLKSDFYDEKPIRIPEADTLLNQSLNNPDPTQREVLYKQIEKSNQEHIAKIPLIYGQYATLVSSHISGYNNTGLSINPTRWIKPVPEAHSSSDSKELK